MKALLSNHHQSPRKVRLAADLIRGKSVENALIELSFLNKRIAVDMKKVIDSAISNAVNNFKQDKDELFVKEIRIDKGITIKRRRPGCRGISRPINKRTSHILVVLDAKPKKIAKVEKKEVKIKKETVKKVKKTEK